MRSLLERLIISSTPAWRVLLAIFSSTPFFIIVAAGQAYGLGDPDIRAGLHVDVVWALQALTLLAAAVNIGVGLWLWPRRRQHEPVPRATLAVCLSIGPAFTAVAVLAGTFTEPSNLVLLGVLAVGLLLFEQRPMVIAYAVCVGFIVAQDLGVIAGLWPYAPALREAVMQGGEPVWWFVIWRQFVSVTGYTVLLTLLFVLFERLDALHAKLRRLSYTDALTGLANRRRAMEVLHNEVARQARTGQALSLVLVDADHFKLVNDRHGHDVGDEVLRAIGRLLLACVRTPTDVACRLGGEEFALILPDTRREDALAVCARLREALAQRRFGARGGEDGFSVTLSLGLVEGSGLGVERLLQEGDQQLYRAKSLGRDRICFAGDGAGPADGSRP